MAAQAAAPACIGTAPAACGNSGPAAGAPGCSTSSSSGGKSVARSHWAGRCPALPATRPNSAPARRRRGRHHQRGALVLEDLQAVGGVGRLQHGFAARHVTEAEGTQVVVAMALARAQQHARAVALAQSMREAEASAFAAQAQEGRPRAQLRLLGEDLGPRQGGIEPLGQRKQVQLEFPAARRRGGGGNSRAPTSGCAGGSAAARADAITRAMR